MTTPHRGLLHESMDEVSTGTRELRELYGAATRASEQFHAAMLRYFRASAARGPEGKVRDCLEDYIALGQQYSTALEMLLYALTSSPFNAARAEAERVEGVLWRHDEQLRRLYSALRAGATRGRPSVSAMR